MEYAVTRTLHAGVERITYTPRSRRFQTPILMQHGMWHGAWCWQWWQELLAAKGWEGHALSLPGHAGSPAQRPVRWCTLGYYLRFLKQEIARLPDPPVLLGHSMGGALAQRYLKERDTLPAAVLVASWPAKATLIRPAKGGRDTWGWLWSLATLSAAPLIRTPQRAAALLIRPNALLTPEALHARLGPESILPALQHNPPFWRPAARLRTPLLWLAGADDGVLPEAVERRSAAHYGATYRVIAGAGHNLMMERSYRETALMIHAWLQEQGIT
jgi:pimeloyl-ACP methyl ester carboxylesterase